MTILLRMLALDCQNDGYNGINVKLSWTEPWNREMVRRRMREVSVAMPSVRTISILGGVLAFGAMLGARWVLPECREVLTWAVVTVVTMCCASYAFFPYLVAVFPMCVHMSEKGVFIQCGNGGSLLPCERILSISFEDRNGLHLLVIRFVTKRGKEFERTVLASAKYSDGDVAKFLFDVGLSHLWDGDK